VRPSQDSLVGQLIVLLKGVCWEGPTVGGTMYLSLAGKKWWMLSRIRCRSVHARLASITATDISAASSRTAADKLPQVGNKCLAEIPAVLQARRRGPQLVKRPTSGGSGAAFHVASMLCFPLKFHQPASFRSWTGIACWKRQIDVCDCFLACTVAACHVMARRVSQGPSKGKEAEDSRA
jgi:hypothetical protein